MDLGAVLDSAGQRAPEIAGEFRVEHLAAGTELIRQGAQPDDGLWLLLDGEVEVVASRPEGGFSVVKRVQVGEVLGLLGLIDGEPRSTTCRALSDVVVARMPADRFHALYGARDQLGLAFVDWIAKQMVSDVRRLDGILRDAARQDEGPAPTCVPT